MFPVSMDAIDTRYLYMTSLHVSYKIQNDRHNIISKVIISPSIFETEAFRQGVKISLFQNGRQNCLPKMNKSDMYVLIEVVMVKMSRKWHS